MGVAQSNISPELAVAGAVVAGTAVSAAAYGLYTRSAGSGSSTSSTDADAGAPGKKKKRSAADKEKARADAEFDKLLAAASKEKGAAGKGSANAPKHANVVPFPAVVPGAFDPDSARAVLAPSPQKTGAGAAAKKAKKKKTAKKGGAGAVADEEQGEESQAEPVAPEKEATPTPATEQPATALKKKKRKGAKGAAADIGGALASKTSSGASAATVSRATGLAESYVLSDVPEDASWTRVSARRRGLAAGTADMDVLTSDTNVTQTTTTETTETTEDDEEEEEEGSTAPKKTFAERMLPRPRKTGVEDMEDEPLQPTLARVMRVRPAAGEAPAKGFSWGDYEDYASRDEGTSADGDADDVWEEVKSKRRAKPDRGTSTLTSSLGSSGFVSSSADASDASKRQRQNAKRTEAARQERETSERDRLARLAAHRRELERTRMAEQQAAAGRKKAVSGGMQAGVDANGKLIWE